MDCGRQFACSSRVSFESRYGTWNDVTPDALAPPIVLRRLSKSDRAEMTLASARSPELMLISSFSRSPSAP